MIVQPVEGIGTAAEQGQGAEYAGPMASRRCCRCGKELTDASSLEAGIGPECRDYANELLALEMPVAVSRIDVFALLGTSLVLPEVCQPTWAKVEEKLVPLFQGNEATIVGVDLRATVLRIAWILSFPLADGVREQLFHLIGLLGYPGVEALLRNEVTMGKAKAEFFERRLRVTGTRPKALLRRLAKQGSRNFAEAKRGEGEYWWSILHTEADLFEKLARRYYARLEGLEEALAAARADQGQPALILSGKPVRITAGPRGKLRVFSDYNKDFVNGLKQAFPRWERRWDSQAWEIAEEILPAVEQLIRICYPEAPIVREFAAEGAQNYRF